ncbi:MAG: sugar phosphate isomerase/epimerase [Rhodospirillales bacterium]|nr:sugar phosphate isomerase/epimerase [Rhodospirillales bacterium]
MARSFSLAYLTAERLAPAAAIRLAAELGYDNVGLRLLPAAPGGTSFPLHTDAILLGEALAAQRDTGIGVFDLEIIRIGAAFRAGDHLPFFEAGRRLGARAILVAGDDPDTGRLTASFAALCEAAAPYGLTCDLEFMPWTAVKNCAAAMRVLDGAAQPNARILVDALHFARSATTLAEIAAIPRAQLGYAQICDAPAEIPATDEGLIHTARAERMLPGEGGIDLAGLFAALPADLPVSIEIPSASRVPVLGEREWARQALAATRRVLAAIPHR